ncbi:hypothetical protein DH2020_033303 [Rehmannia glutinosa]|uniref:Pentatricopeptide repeat-containing protein n=1 Tax=Rehmannia glutinosa TaxID=99300 RepID=A0ABR0VFE0_REHGL
MRPSTAENLVSLFRSAVRLTPIRSTASTSSAAKQKRSSSGAAAKKKPSSSSSADDADLKKYVSSITSSSSSSESAKRLLKDYKAPPSSSSTVDNLPKTSLHAIFSDSLNSGCRDDDDTSANQLSDDASSVLYDGMDLDWDNEYESHGNVLQFPWLSRMTNNTISLRRKEFSRVRKQKWVFNHSQTSRFGRLVKMCGMKLGSDTAIEIFGKLGKETGLKEYNALIKICIQRARDTTDEDVSVEQIYKAYRIFKMVRETGFKIEEETYGQFLMYLIDCGMIEEFFFFHELIRDENPDSLPRLAYYEMLLWVRVNNQEKIQELCRSVVADDAEDKSYLRECLLMALCESDRREEFLMLLKTLDITKVSPVTSIERVFRSLGKLLLESYAERFLLALKRSDIGAGNISNLIREYAISIPNLAVEDIIVKFQKLHDKFEVLPTSTQYEKLIRYCCENLKVHEALNVVDEAFKCGIALSLETFHSILDACYTSCEFNLVKCYLRIQIKCGYLLNHWSALLDSGLKLAFFDREMKGSRCGLEGANGLIRDLPKMDVKPTAGMYNIILAGYFREKNIQRAMNVLKQMEDSDVKPNALTYSYLIGNSHCEKDIIKFFDDMSNSGVQPTKYVYMALINAYASCGLFENAKKVSKLNLFQSLLQLFLYQMGSFPEDLVLSDALKIYEEIKKAECDLNPKAIRCLIEYFQAEGELNKSLQLLEELNDSPYWADACFTVISSCVRHEDLRCTVDLLKQLKDKYMNAEVARDEVLFDEVFCLFYEKEPRDMQFGLNLLQAIKEELGVQPSRKSLDFLLSACVTAKDSKASFVIWKEYETAGLPYNVLSFVRMYQALLASGDNKSAAKILLAIRKDDPHVRPSRQACQKHM